MMETGTPPPILITDELGLQRAAEVWKDCSALAMDTEFVRTDTFYAKLGLIQISDGNHCWLIDPLTINDFSVLIAMMRNPSIVKVFHATSEDLEILQQSLGCLPEPLFDTQIAAALTGYGYSRGYAALVKVMLGHELGKHETRSDWTRRPLSSAQLGYAADDVYYLAALYPKLLERLRELNRGEWMEEEMGRLLDKSRQTEELSHYYRKIKGAWLLDAKGLSFLQGLCEWREREARSCDKPRNRIVSDKVLLEIAISRPLVHNALKNIEGIHPRSIRVYGSKLLAFVADDNKQTVVNPLKALEKPLPREAGSCIKKLRSLVNAASEKEDLPSEIVATRKDLEALVRSADIAGGPTLPATLASGWRYGIIGKSLLADYITFK